MLIFCFSPIDVDDPRVPTGICDTCRIKSKNYTNIPSTDLTMENFEDVDPNLDSDCYCLLCKIFREPTFGKKKKKQNKTRQKLEKTNKEDLKEPEPEVKISGDQYSNQNTVDDDPLAVETTAAEEVSFELLISRNFQ